MDAGTLTTALRMGDVPALIKAIEWDGTYIPDMPDGFLDPDMLPPFLGLFGAVTVGATQHAGGKYEVRFHTHPDAQTARECFDLQVTEVKQMLAIAELANLI